MADTGLPSVTISFSNGNIGATEAIADRVFGLLATASAVESTFVLGTAYYITSLKGLTALGVTATNNSRLYKEVKEFYTEAPMKSPMWMMGVPAGTQASDILDKDAEVPYASNLVKAANGAITYLSVALKDADNYTPTILNGLDSDVYTAITKAQALAEYYTESIYAPFFVLLEGRHYSGTPSALSALSTRSDNRVGILIADTEGGSGNACVGLLAGRIAAIPVQRSIARVKTGAIGVDDVYIGSVAAENGDPDTIHDKGFITARTFTGKSGYYWSDDQLATNADDDYKLIPRRSVADKAYRLAYQTAINELSDEIPVTDDGTIPAAIVKHIQNEVDVAIQNNMTSKGNLGNDPSDPADTGVTTYIDETQDVVTSSELNMQLRIKPYGYNKYITIDLGFSTNA